MKFDSNRAWSEAAASIRANKEVVATVAGVFFLLPSLAFALFFPAPQAPAGAQGQAMIDLMGAWYGKVLPFVIPVAILQASGTLTLLTLLSDRSRPTVREAIRQGFAGLLPYLGAQLLIGFGLGVAGLMILGMASVTKLAIVAVAALLVGALYIFIRTALVAPVVAVEGVKSPLAAIARSWGLTRGNAARILSFFLLLLATMVVASILTMVVGGLLVLLLPANVATAITTVVTSAFGAGVALYFVSVLAAIHRQLAGDGPQSLGRIFD